jgi:tRNA nucleotidyltransferase/poly(A) polymerase
MKPLAIRTTDSVRRSLASRLDVRVLEAAARSLGQEIWLVGGIIRDTFLGRPCKDLDVACTVGSAERFGELLREGLGARVLSVGRPPRRIVKVICKLGEIDIWEFEDPASDEDLLRRDFTINTFRYSLPGRELTSVSSALSDLRAGVLRLPRPGVLLEDPVRVLRAARFIAHFPWMRMQTAARDELREAAGRLDETAPERRLSELDRILVVPGKESAVALQLLERWSALAATIPGSKPGERRAGRALVRESRLRDPGFLRNLLLLPLGGHRLVATLESWKARRRDFDLAQHLLALEPGVSAELSPRRNLVNLVRSCSRFLPESLEFLRLTGPASVQPLLERAHAVIRNPGRLARILTPDRPVPATELFGLANLPPGPARMELLAEVDARIAAGQIRSAAGLRTFAIRARH